MDFKSDVLNPVGIICFWNIIYCVYAFRYYIIVSVLKKRVFI